MSNTRRRAEGQPPTQQGYASSVQYERGLLANLVAQRCEVLDAAEDRELLFALQYVSHQPGGLAKLADTLIADYPDQVATPAMQKIGLKPGQICNAKQVRAVRAEIPNGEESFLLKGECSLWNPYLDGRETITVEDLTTGQSRKELAPRFLEAKIEASKRPNSYSAEDFVRECNKAAKEHLAEFIERLCLDPSTALDGRWYFPELISDLRRHFARCAQAARARIAETAITRQVYEALDYGLAGDGITLIEGLARTGKTFAVKAWCEQRPGLARYVQVPPTNDDVTFYRRIAEAYGVSSCLSMKSSQVRERVERTARTSKLMLVLDEAHYLLSQDYRCRKRPSRIAWVMNELVNCGVPVSICTTPQFIADKARIQDRTGWAWEQFDGRIGYLAALDRILSPDDLKAVARVHLPEASADAICGVAKYAQGSASYVAGIEHVAKRARYNAQREGRKAVSTADVVRAIKARLPLDMNGQLPAPAAASAKRAVTPRNAGRKRNESLSVPRGVTPAIADIGHPPARSTELETVPVC